MLGFARLRIRRVCRKSKVLRCCVLIKTYFYIELSKQKGERHLPLPTLHYSTFLLLLLVCFVAGANENIYQVIARVKVAAAGYSYAVCTSCELSVKCCVCACASVCVWGCVSSAVVVVFQFTRGLPSHVKWSTASPRLETFPLLLTRFTVPQINQRVLAAIFQFSTILMNFWTSWEREQESCAHFQTTLMAIILIASMSNWVLNVQNIKSLPNWNPKVNCLNIFCL